MRGSVQAYPAPPPPSTPCPGGRPPADRLPARMKKPGSRVRPPTSPAFDRVLQKRSTCSDTSRKSEYDVFLDLRGHGTTQHEGGDRSADDDDGADDDEEGAVVDRLHAGYRVPSGRS